VSNLFAVVVNDMMMSTKNNNEPDDDMMMCCASCGVAEVDDIKLKTCVDCKSVRYCSDKCKGEHLPQHEQACNKPATELRDEILFRQPEGTDLGDCPICFLPLSIYLDQSSFYSCCSKVICNGCDYANELRDEQENLKQKCPFCRHPKPDNQEEIDLNVMKRVAKNDPFALREAGTNRYKEGDYEGAIAYWTKAAEMEDTCAHYQLSNMYREGIGVERDDKKAIYHLEEAAIAGNPNARFNLACYEGRNRRIDRAVKHLIIAANLGHDVSVQRLKMLYAKSVVSKEDFAAALRAHHAAVVATKSPQREAANALLPNMG
jgi:tetratricopeptide (TPR) repeat protein